MICGRFESGGLPTRHAGRNAAARGAGPLGGTTHGSMAYQPVSPSTLRRAPTNWPRHHLSATGPGTTSPLAPEPPPPTRPNSPRGVHNLAPRAPGYGSIEGSCTSVPFTCHVRPSLLPTGAPRRGAPPPLVSPNARASAGGLPPAFATTFGLAAASRGGEPRARSARRWTSGGGATEARPRQPSCRTDDARPRQPPCRTNTRSTAGRGQRACHLYLHAGELVRGGDRSLGMRERVGARRDARVEQRRR